MEKTNVTINDIHDAEARIDKYIRHTPLLRESQMDKILGCQIYLKPEMLQITGAFKLRGALNKILSIPKDELKKGIITSSSGNHGQACAYAGQMLNIHATVVIPEDAPTVKSRNAKNMGAEVISWDRSYAERWKKVDEEVKEHGYTIVHPFEDFNVMAGQGTIGLEIMKSLPDVETVLVPIGGGGLISGISTAIKETNPKIRVVGVQAAASCAYYASRINGKRTEFESRETLADGITCGKTGTNPYPIIEKYVDEIVVVKEETIKEAVKLIADYAKLIAEPTSSVVIAALLEGNIKVRSDEKVCAVLTSGNWDIDKIGKVFNNEPVKGVL
ncbi:MAG: threonine/serine dehydratase [Clostridia bacterium]|nr:threonine/serine dehydratase [Clostridia bacterium]MCI2013617.1 threonine/serine dehydratase [Clostridia bacterium]